MEQLKALLPQCLLPDQLRIGLRLARLLSRRHGDSRVPEELIHRWLQEARASVSRREQRRENVPALNYPPLPITARRKDILDAIGRHQVLVIAGETGSGKTTQLPKICLEAGLGIRARIGCTQPRRVAALSLSRRLAEELDVAWGREVGCKIRFADQSSPDTYIKFMTDGILLAEMQGDPWLSEYEALILDEAHERSLNIDFLLGHLVQLLARRTDLKLIITSATIDTAAFSEAFHQAPVIEVSGRMYPVEVIYRPLESPGEEEDEVTYVEAAVQTVEDIVRQSGSGDVLVFMPGEKDILETRDLMQRQTEGMVDIVPLFGRLSADEQQRIFAPSNRRKVVIATNIAETSLTVPGIRYVVDTGLARISRYNPRTRARRLPIEPVSQSSANQRKGRCGRVADGICIRLYSEQDYEERPPYTQPEIQRSNLAEVILRMKAYHLGDIETFPFLNPPKPQAIQGGYELLQELGALDDKRQLTDLGRQLARLPVDPTIGRMIIQAQQEGALADVLVIAAGLSIQDPRERPLAKLETAASAQRKFHDPKSDFLSLLNIWNAFHDTLESLRTQGKMRKFCQAHFLSYQRMREWRDTHAQLEEMVRDLDLPVAPSRAADYAAIHRSILTGLWGHVANRHERNIYRLAGNRQAMVFPGSGLFVKTEKPKGRRPASDEAEGESKPHPQPSWVVAGEIMETSRSFLRNVAVVEPDWIVELASHLCQRRYEEIRWEPRSGRVLATEHITLNGLEVMARIVGYLRVNASEATEIFIRRALVEEELTEHFQGRNQASNAPSKLTALPALYGFLTHNHQLRQKLEIWQTRKSHRVAPDLDEAFFRYYSARLPSLGSVHDLNRVLKERHAKEPEFLRMTLTDLLGDTAKGIDLDVFPDTIQVGEQPVEVAYAYAPGDEQDGVTLRLPFTLAQVIDSNLLDWAVPGLREERILHLLQALPKHLRRGLMPLPAKARELALALQPSGSSLLAELSRLVQITYGVTVPPDAWAVDQLPVHLRPRWEIMGKDRQLLASGRDLDQLRQKLHSHDTPAETTAWRLAAQKWERYGLQEWVLNDVPSQITVTEVAGFPLLAYPALQVEAGEIHLRLFTKLEEAEASNRQGLPALARKALARELAWLQKDLRALDRCKMHYASLGSGEELEETAFDNLITHLLHRPALPPLTREGFAAYVSQARQSIAGLAPGLVDRVSAILSLRQEVLLCHKPYPGLRYELDALVPPRFLRQVPYDRLLQLPRYLKAMLVRAERAALNPAKDAEKVRRIQPYVEKLRHLVARPNIHPETKTRLQEFRWLIEEFKVSCFAQELGTAEPVSPRRLDERLSLLEQGE
jgi:ATP-dependent helicase HrpA